MKRYLIALFALMPMCVHAQVTPNLQLNLPTVGSSGWAEQVNQNFSLLDGFLSGVQPLPQITLSGPITNANQAATKQYVDTHTTGFTLTTTGSTGPATLIGGVLNVPQYAGATQVYPGAGVAVSTGSAWGASLTLATVATSGSYADLTNKPTIPAAQVNSDWNSITGLSQILNKPTLATVATSGSYTDLTSKPTIPAAQVNSDWSAGSGISQILNKPTIPAAQVSADWNSAASPTQILNKPTLGTAAAQNTSAFDAAGAAAAAQSAAEAASDPAGSATTAQAASLQKTSNLSDLVSASTARTNLGLGTAATQATGAFDAAGSATAAQTAAEAAFTGDVTKTAGSFATTVTKINGTTPATVATSGSYPDLINRPTLPVGTIVGTTDTQALTNKTVDGISPATLAFVDPTSSIQTQFNAKQANLTLTTTGTSGAATLTGSALNIPQYAGGGSMIYPSGSGVPVVASGASWGITVPAPAGTIVGTTDTQTLTNKTLDGVTPTTMGFVDFTSSAQTQLNAKLGTGTLYTDARSYGIVGDGTTDNGAALNTMLSTVCSNTALPRTVALPIGTVLTTIPIVPPATCYKLNLVSAGSGGRTGSPTQSLGSTRISFTGSGAAIQLGTEATPAKATITSASRTANVITVVTAYNATLAALTSSNQIMVRNLVPSDLNTEDTFLASVATDGSTEVTLTFNSTGTTESASSVAGAYVDLAHNDNSYYPSTNSAFGLESLSISCDSSTRTNLLNFQSYTGQQSYATNADGIDAWRAPNLVINHVNVTGCKTGFYGTNSDEDKFNDTRFTNNHIGKYLDTQSSQDEDRFPYASGNDMDYLVDGAWGTSVYNLTSDSSGSSTTSPITLQATQQARNTVGFACYSCWFENNHGSTSVAYKSFMSIGETGSGSVLGVDIENPNFSMPMVPTASAPQTTSFATIGFGDQIHVFNPINDNHTGSTVQPNPFFNETGTYSPQDITLETGLQGVATLATNSGAGVPLIVWNQHVGGNNILGGKHVQVDSQGTATSGTTGFNSDFFDICGSFYASSTANRSCWEIFASVGPSFNNVTVQPTTVGNPSAQWTWGQPVASTSGANQASIPMFWQYRVQHASADTSSSMKLQVIPSTGNDPAVEVSLLHSGSDTGAVDFKVAAVKSVLQSSETVTFSATPTFSTATRASIITLTANITSFTLAAGADGQEKTLEFCENATGGFTVTPPSNVVNFSALNTAASTCSSQHFTYSAVQTAWEADGLGTGTSISGGGNVSNTGTPTSGQVGVWTSATVLSGVTATGTGSPVLATSPTLTTPALGTPSAAILTNATGLPISTGVSGLATGMATFLGTPTSANLAATVTNETGSGLLVFGTSPTLVTPILGTPTSGTLTNATGLPISTGVSGLATGVATLLGTPTSANLAAALTDETGTGSAVFATSPTLVTPALGTPASGVMTNVTGLPLSTGVTGVLPAANGGVPIANTTFTNATTLLTANSCSASAVTVTMTGLATTSVIWITPNADASASTGWGANGGLVIDAWPSAANTLSYKICNQSSASITPGAITWNVGAH